MHVSMDKIPGLPLLKQRIETLKSHVGKIIHIPVSACRCMGQQNVESIHKYSPYLGHSDTSLHIVFRVLIAPGVIPHAAPESQYAEPFVVVDRIFDANATPGRLCFIFAVMVPADVKEGTVGQRDQKFQIS